MTKWLALLKAVLRFYEDALVRWSSEFIIEHSRNEKDREQAKERMAARGLWRY